MDKKYVTQVTISFYTSGTDKDDAYIKAHAEVFKHIQAGTDTYIERIEVSDA